MTIWIKKKVIQKQKLEEERELYWKKEKEKEEILRREKLEKLREKSMLDKVSKQAQLREELVK